METINMGTIVSIATALGEGAVAIVRLSGSNAAYIGDKMFSKNVSSAQSHLLQYGHVIDTCGNVIDECLCVIMRSPRSFTGEDVVEIHSHGGYASSHRILETALSHGAVLAGRGEFTKRAFLNGKFDLSRAEAIIDIVNAKTNHALSLGVSQLQGALSRDIARIRNLLLEACAKLYVSMDYPDDHGCPDISPEIDEAKSEISALISGYQFGNLVKHGAVFALVGPPNSGKSSLLNSLLDAERSIVTHVAGTTRDVVEDFLEINGIQIRLGDTAGIRDIPVGCTQADLSSYAIEQMGIDKTRQYIEKSDFCLLVVDCSADNHLDAIFDIIGDKKYLLILNKCDLPQKYFSDQGVLVSAKTGQGIADLRERIYSLLVSHAPVQNHGIITNLRHKQALDIALECLCRCENSALPPDLLCCDVESAISALGLIDGLTVTDEVIDKVFSEFCVGK